MKCLLTAVLMAATCFASVPVSAPSSVRVIVQTTDRQACDVQLAAGKDCIQNTTVILVPRGTDQIMWRVSVTFSNGTSTVSTSKIVLLTDPAPAAVFLGDDWVPQHVTVEPIQ